MKTQPVTKQQAHEAGFAVYNDVPHYCLEVPDGNSTITIKTSEGKLMTVALLKYTEDGSPQCADVASHSNLDNNNDPQNIRVFNKGLTSYYYDPTEEVTPKEPNPPVLTSILFLDRRK